MEINCTCKWYACHQIEYLIINQTKKLPYFLDIYFYFFFPARYIEVVFYFIYLFIFRKGMAISMAFGGLQFHFQFLMIKKSSIVANLFPQP